MFVRVLNYSQLSFVHSWDEEGDMKNTTGFLDVLQCGYASYSGASQSPWQLIALIYLFLSLFILPFKRLFVCLLTLSLFSFFHSFGEFICAQYVYICVQYICVYMF